MALSGTFSHSPSFDEIFLLAIDAAGGDPSNANELRHAKQKMDLLLLDWNNRSLLLHKMEDVVVTCSASQGSYVLDVTYEDVYKANIIYNSRDLPLGRDSMEDFFEITNKTQVGRPTRFWVDRALEGPIMHLWPLPSQGFELRLKVQVQPQNVGQASFQLDIPPRLIPAAVAGLAWMIAKDRTGDEVFMAKVEKMKSYYEEVLSNSFSGDRDRASTYLRPGRHGVK